MDVLYELRFSQLKTAKWQTGTRNVATYKNCILLWVLILNYGFESTFLNLNIKTLNWFYHNFRKLNIKVYTASKKSKLNGGRKPTCVWTLSWTCLYLGQSLLIQRQSRAPIYGPLALLSASFMGLFEYVQALRSFKHI